MASLQMLWMCEIATTIRSHCSNPERIQKGHTVLYKGIDNHKKIWAGLFELNQRMQNVCTAKASYRPRAKAMKPDTN